MVIKTRNTRIKIIRHNEKGKKSDKLKLVVVSHFIYIYIYIYKYGYTLSTKNQETKY